MLFLWVTNPVFNRAESLPALYRQLWEIRAEGSLSYELVSKDSPPLADRRPLSKLAEDRLYPVGRQPAARAVLDDPSHSSQPVRPFLA